MNSPFRHIQGPLPQKYARYLPTAFSDDFTMLEKVNKTIYVLEEVIEYNNSVSDFMDETVTNQNEQIQKTVDEFTELKGWLEGDGLGENVDKVLNEWLDDGKLAEIINNDVFNMKLDTNIFNEKISVIDEQLRNINMSVKDYGAVGDGITDDTQAIKLAISLLNNNILHFPHGTYRVTEDIEITKNINIRGDNSTILQDGNVTMFIKGSVVELVTKFSGDASVGQREIALTDATGIKKGDILILTNTSDFSFSEYRSYYFDGEYVEVLEVIGNTLKLTSQLETSYGTTSNFKIYKMSGVKANIEDLNIKKRVVGNTRANLQLEQVCNTTLANVNMESGNVNDALFVLRAYKLTFDRCNIRNTSQDTEQNGYGVVMRACQYVSVYDSSFYARRHASAVGAYGEHPCPISRHINFYNCTFTSFAEVNNTHSADFHGSIKNGYYHNCVFYGGVVLAGEDTGVYGGVVYGKGTQGGMYYREIKGGTIEFRDITYITENNNSAFSYHSSSEMQNISKDVNYVIKNVELTYNNVAPDSHVTIHTGSENDAMITIDVESLKTNVKPISQLVHILSASGNKIKLDRLIIKDCNVEPNVWYKLPTFITTENTRITLPTVTIIDTTNFTQSSQKNTVLNTRFQHKNPTIIYSVISLSEEVPVLIMNGTIKGDGVNNYFFTTYFRNYGTLPSAPVEMKYMVTVLNNDINPIF